MKNWMTLFAPLLALLLAGSAAAGVYDNPPAPYAVGTFPIGIGTGDFNGDGFPDIAVASNSTNSVDILINNGDGTFAAAVPYPANFAPQLLTIGDFNGDGRLDVAATSSDSTFTTSEVTVLLGNGDGTFQAPVNSVVIAGASTGGLVAADFNGDGILDLATSFFNPASGTGALGVLRGNGDGSFQPPLVTLAGGNAGKLAAGRFNADANVDIVMLDTDPTTFADRVDVFPGNGDGTFQPPGFFPTGSTSEDGIVAADFNGDGNLDVAVGNACIAEVDILLGNGDGTLQGAMVFPSAPSGCFSSELVSGDVNGDGIPDLAVTRTGTTVDILLGNGDGTFGAPIPLTPIGQLPLYPALADFNGDGRLDLAVTLETTNNINVWLNSCVSPTANVTGGGTICAGLSTTVQAALAGTGPWTVTWSDGVVDSNVAVSPDVRTVSPAVTTTYTVTGLTDATRCAPPVLTGSALATVNNPPSATVSGTQTICAGRTATIQAALTGLGPWTVTWSDGVVDGNVAASPDVRTVSPAVTTTYTVTAVSDASGCTPGTSSGSVIVTVLPVPTAAVSGGGTICQGQSATIQASLTGGPPWSVTWSDGVTDVVNASPDARTVTPAATTTYTVTAVSDATGCAGSSSGSATVTVNPSPASPVASNNGPICAGQTLQLSASSIAGATYGWTGPNGFTSNVQNPAIPNATPADSGVYTVTATAAGCASAPASTNAAVNPAPSAAITAPSSVPANSGGHPASVPNAGAGAVYNWSISFGSITAGAGTESIVFSVGASGPAVLSVTVVSAAGCFASATRDVAVAGGGGACTLSCSATVPAGAAAGSAVPFQASSSASGACTGNPSYSWNFGDGATSNSQNPAHTYAAAGSYTWTLTVTLSGATSCVRTGVILVGANPSPGCALGCTATVPSGAGAGAPVAFASAASLSAECNGSPAFSWDFGDGSTSTDQNPSHTYASPGNYTWRLTINLPGAQSCKRTGQITITPNPPGCVLDCTVTVPASAAAGDPVAFEAVAVLSGDCNGTPVYSWDFGDGSTSNDQNATHVYPGPGTYVWTETARLGIELTCSQSGILTITGTSPCDPPDMPLSPKIDPIGNPGGIITITDYLVQSWLPPNTGTPPTAYAYWINSETPTLTSATSAIANPRGDNHDLITLFVQAVACGPAQTGAIAMSPTYSLGPPTANFSVTPSPAVVGQPVTFTDTSAPQATGWLWLYDDGGEDLDIQSPTHTFTTPGVHTIALIATNGSGSDVKVVSLTVNPPAGLPPQAESESRVRAFDDSNPLRQRLNGVNLRGEGFVWLRVSTPGPAEAVVFLRIENPDGTLVKERRLVLGPGREAAYDLGAFGVAGERNLALVSGQAFTASLSTAERRIPVRKGDRDE